MCFAQGHFSLRTFRLRMPAQTKREPSSFLPPAVTGAPLRSPRRAGGTQAHGDRQNPPSLGSPGTRGLAGWGWGGEGQARVG